MACYLLSKAQQKTVLTCYTFNLAEVTSALKSAAETRCEVCVYADAGHTMMGSTLLQAEKLSDLQEAGVKVYLTSGISGSSGIQHSKTLLVDDYLIVGSTNWTTSSKQNEEMSVLVHLNPDGFDQFEKRFKRLNQRSSEFTRERAVRARDARAARQELRGNSVPDIHRTAKRFSIARAKSRDALKLA